MVYLIIVKYERENMQFYVEGYCSNHNIPEQKMDIYPHVKLVTDDFDDYGNQTLFRLYYKRKEKENYQFIGKVKILNSENYIVRNIIEKKFLKLGTEFCSLGQSTEYYSRLKELNKNGSEQGREILVSLNDIAINSDLKEKFPDQAGINNSLMRDSEAYHAWKLGHNVFYGLSSHIEDEVKFTYTYDRIRDKKVSFQFNDKTGLPNRINVVVGKNGTGKTKMLSFLASTLSGYRKLDGEHEIDVRPEFSRYIAVSYSAFDNFQKPFGERWNKRELVQEKLHVEDEIRKYKEKCSKRAEKDKDFEILYKYFDHLIDSIETFEKKEKFDEYFTKLLQGDEYEKSFLNEQVGSYVYCGLLQEHRLISEDEMLAVFKRNLSEVIRMRRDCEWKEIMRNIFDGVEDLKRVFETNHIEADKIDDDGFRSLSSGQKIMLHIFTQVIMSITEDSLLLIDEPEIHLHPNAVSSFMRMLNKLLEKFNSFAIISTHSPIVLQEIPARYVRIFDNNEFYDEKLWEECFGDNISGIIKNVFNVRPDESNYKTFFQKQKEDGISKESVEEMFDNGLSINAEMYLNILYEDEE